MSIEVDLSKPLLSKFRLHGKVWRIQYEGLKLICFKCGKIGHKEDTCPHYPNPSDIDNHDDSAPKAQDPTMVTPNDKPEYLEDFGTWMPVKKPPRWKVSRPSSIAVRDKDSTGRVNPDRRSMPEQESNIPINGINTNKETGSNMENIRTESLNSLVQGSRFAILGEEMEVENQAVDPLAESTKLPNSIGCGEIHQSPFTANNRALNKGGVENGNSWVNHVHNGVEAGIIPNLNTQADCEISKEIGPQAPLGPPVQLTSK